MKKNILPIVEGQTEVEVVPRLIRRILEQKQVFYVKVVKPFRVKRQRVVKEGELERAIKVGLLDREDVGAVLVILDADDDCPKELGPKLLIRTKKVTTLPVSVVIVNKELECWFLGAKESLRGIRGIKSDAVTPNNPEGMDGKGGIKRNLNPGCHYIGVGDAPEFAERFEFIQASNKCPSLKRFINEIERLVAEMNISNLNPALLERLD